MPLVLSSMLISVAMLEPTAMLQQHKSTLLSRVAALRKEPTVAARNAVLLAIQDLETNNVIDAPPDGRWSLIFSTQAETPDPNRPGANVLQPLIDATYGAFFKVAPALAGAQQDGGSGASNEQMLSLSTGIVENRVRIPLPFAQSSLEICVDGAVEAGSTEPQQRQPQLLDVTFTECSFAIRRGAKDEDGNALRIPLPRPVGTLRTTHCDDELRVSRGGRGGVFVLKRLRS